MASDLELYRKDPIAFAKAVFGGRVMPWQEKLLRRLASGGQLRVTPRACQLLERIPVVTIARQLRDL